MSDSGWVADILAGCIFILLICLAFGSISLDESKFIEIGCEEWDNTGWNWACKINNTWYEANLVNEELVLFNYKYSEVLEEEA